MTQVSIQSRDGLTLEGLVEQPDKVRAAVVICHPHPDMGGTMNAPLLTALSERLQSADWAVVRFNFRGVGGSEGRSSPGEDEVADVLGAVDLARDRVPGVSVAIVGWSYGGAVAIRACAEDPSIVACAAIAPAVLERPGVTAGLPPGERLDISIPVLIVCGSNDDQIPPLACKTWAESLPHARYVEMPGANHFFWAKYEKLADLVADFLDSALAKKETG